MDASDELGFAEDYDDEAARLIREKYGVPEPEGESDDEDGKGGEMPRDDGSGAAVGAKFQGDFDFQGAGFQQVQSLTEDNATLVAQMDEKNSEIDRLTDLIAAIEPIPGMEPEKFLDIMQGGELVDQDPRDVKIVQLAKAKRNMNLALQKEKDRVHLLEGEIERLKEIAENKVYPQKMHSKKHEEAKAEVAAEADKDRQIDTYKARSQTLSRQVMEVRVKLHAAERDLKAATAALQREVGPKADLAKILKDGGENNWRGRAQKMSLMKAKIRDLEQQLEESKGADEPRRPTRAPTVDDQAKAELRAMNAERQRAVEAITEDYHRVAEEAEAYKKKAEASKLRMRTLENEQKKMKTHLKTLLSKATKDDEFVDALRQEVADLRRKNAGLTGDLRSTRSDLERSVSTLGNTTVDGEDATLRSQLDNAMRRLDAQEKIIQSLRGEIRIARSNKPTGSRSGDGHGGGGGASSKPPLGSGRPSSAERVRAAAKRESEFADANLKLLQMDNVRMSEAQNLLKNQLREVQDREEGHIEQIAELQRALATRERELGVQRSGIAARTQQKPTPDKVAALQEAHDTLKEENAALRRSFRKQISARDEELAVAREQLESQQRLYGEQLERFRKKNAALAEAGSDGTDEMEMANLKRDNEVLRRELTDVRLKYQQLNARMMRES